MKTKMIGIKGNVSDIDVKQIDKSLDKAEELVNTHNIYLDEAMSVINGTKTLNEVLKERKDNNTLSEGAGGNMRRLNEAYDKIIKEVDWNGHHFTFTNNFHSTGTKSHDVLVMEDENGNRWTGETTWVNRPWHIFDLEEAFDEIVSKAFGQKALALVQEIDKSAHSVEEAVDKFFSQFKPEDIQHNEKEAVDIDDSEEGRKNALAKELGVDPGEIEEEGNNEFTYEEATYKVLTEDESDELFDENIRSLWDDLGLDGLRDGWLKDWILENALNEEELEEFVSQDINDYVFNDMDDEEVAERCIDNDIVESEEVYNEDDGNYLELREDVDFDELREKLVETMLDEIDNYAEYLKGRGFGDEFFSYYIDDEKVIDALKDDIEINGSGRGQEIAYYDGREIDLDNGLYAYRIN